ncbi:uncharacterized protein WM277_023831 isoform 1-T1 [Molossus nigricans]
MQMLCPTSALHLQQTWALAGRLPGRFASSCPRSPAAPPAASPVSVSVSSAFCNPRSPGAQEQLTTSQIPAEAPGKGAMARTRGQALGRPVLAAVSRWKEGLTAHSGAIRTDTLPNGASQGLCRPIAPQPLTLQEPGRSQTLRSPVGAVPAQGLEHPSHL